MVVVVVVVGAEEEAEEEEEVEGAAGSVLLLMMMLEVVVVGCYNGAGRRDEDGEEEEEEEFGLRRRWWWRGWGLDQMRGEQEVGERERSGGHDERWLEGRRAREVLLTSRQATHRHTHHAAKRALSLGPESLLSCPDRPTPITLGTHPANGQQATGNRQQRV